MPASARLRFQAAGPTDAHAMADWSPSSGLYLWVLEQNSDARAFHAARGGACVERAEVPPPGGDAAPAQRRADGPAICTVPHGLTPMIIVMTAQARPHTVPHQHRDRALSTMSSALEADASQLVSVMLW